MSALVQKLEHLYRDLLGFSGPIALHSPVLDGAELSYLKDCIDSGWVSSAGSYVNAFEQRIAALCGTRHAIATVNGTAALHVALHALGVRRDDLVVCPPITFVATANAIAYCGAAPLFVDIEPATLGLDPAALERLFAQECVSGPEGPVHRATGRRVAAIMAVHLFGHPAALDRLVPISAEYGVPLVEDAAEALGSTFRERPCGSWGRLGALSFNGNKIVTTGGGGMVVTDDDALGARIRHLTTTARCPGPSWSYDHDEVGFNYRLPNINAALGCAQLDRLESFLARKRRLAALYAEHLADINDAVLVAEPPGARSNWWLNAVWLADATVRDQVLNEANARGIELRPCWRPISELPAFREAPRLDGLPVATDVAARIVNLPSSAWLMKEAV